MPQTTFHTTREYADSRRARHAFDAKDQVLGRLASKAAALLIGKHKPHFSPSVDCGDFVVITNAAKIRLTGDKLNQKTYFRHSGYAGGAKVIPLKRKMAEDPAEVVVLAVKRMLGTNRLKARRLRRLQVFKEGGSPDGH